MYKKFIGIQFYPMLRLGWLRLWCLFCIGLSLPVLAQGWHSLDENIRKSAQDRRHYQAITLDNGMKILLVSDPEAHKSLAALSLPVGSLDNPPQQQGLAHYLEHMILMGSKRYPEAGSFAEFLKKHGGNHNASTALYRTAYYFEVENDALPQALDRLADAIAAPLLDHEHADRERHAVNAELTMARARDGMRMGQVSAETMNPNHPASRFAGGNLETLSDKPESKLQDELLTFYQRYYSANLMVGVIYSNQPLTKMAEMAAETFGRIAKHQAAVPVTHEPVVTPQQQGVIIHYIPAQPRKQLRIEFNIANNSAAFRSKTDTYISYLIGNRSPNTLSDWLQRQGLVDAISAGSDPMTYRDSGTFSINLSLTDKGLQQRDTVVAAVFSYLQLLRREGIQQRYFDEIAQVLDLSFRYPSITRDMGYVENLVDMLLRVPIQHVLDANYLADQFDAKAIAARLESMTPQQARIWFISPDEPHNKVAYFVNAPYQVDKISAERFAHWQKLAGTLSFTLPTLNPYIPDDFTLYQQKTADEGNRMATTTPQLLSDKPGLRALFMPSRYFADQPKADITLALRNPHAQDTARHQVLYALTDYLAGLSLDQLDYQASVGSINFSIKADNGAVFRATGFTQRLPTLLEALLQGYASFKPTEAQLQQAKSWYQQQLLSAEQVRAYELAIQPVQMLSLVPYSERSERRTLLETITLPEVLAYRDTLLHQSALELLVVGNMTTQQVRELADNVHNQLASQGTAWWRGENVRITQRQLANLQRQGSSTDSALATVYIPIGYDNISGQAHSLLLAQIVHPWFYDQLRSQEQLGYALFASPMSIGQQWGVAFLLQSNSRQPGYLYQRYLDFYRQTNQRLQTMKADDFAQYQQALIRQLRQPPETLREEANRLHDDFSRGNLAFDRREKLIAAIARLTVPQLAEFFRQAVIDPQGLALTSQISGNQDKKADYVTSESWHTYPNASTLQQTLPRQVVGP